VPKYSIVVPLHNEQENVTDLYDRLKAVMETAARASRLCWWMMGPATTRSPCCARLRRWIAASRLVKLRRNFGQTAGLAAGFDHARGEYIIAMDGDLQHDPADIPVFWRRLQPATTSSAVAQGSRR